MKPPELITEEHDLTQFTCTHAELSTWLQQKSLRNNGSGAAKTYVVCPDSSRTVIGYYALATCVIHPEEAIGSIKRNMPSPIPGILLGRLAVHDQWEGQGIGKGLLKDALLRSIEASKIVGVRAMLCHAIDEKAKAFYIKHGFQESKINPLTVMLQLNKN